MTLNESTSANSEALAAPTDAVLGEAAALRAALNRARTIRWILLALVLVLAGGASISFYRLGAQFQQDDYLEKLRAVAADRLDENSDLYTRELGKVSEKVSPVLVEALSKQANKDLPAHLQAAKLQADAFSKNVQRDVLAKVSGYHEESIDRHRSLFDEEFPTLQNEVVKQRLAVNLRLAAEKLAQKYCIDQLSRHLEELFSLWDGFPPARPLTKESPPAEEELVGTLLELASYRLAQPPRVAAQP